MMFFFCIVLCLNRFASALKLIPPISPGAGPKQWLILRVSLTHSAESRDLLFLAGEIVDNIFQWDVLKNMRQIKGYDDMFQAIRAVTVKKILKIRISSKIFLKNERFSRFLSNALI